VLRLFNKFQKRSLIPSKQPQVLAVDKSLLIVVFAAKSSRDVAFNLNTGAVDDQYTDQSSVSIHNNLSNKTVLSI
jgi:hypothetical protein